MTVSLALFHGFTGAPSVWDPVLVEVPSPRWVWRPWMLGHGRRGGASAASFGEEVTRLAGELRTALPAPRHLVGYSMGGRLALAVVVRHPGLVRSMTLIGASPGLGDEVEREERCRQDEVRARRLEERGIDAFVDEWRALDMFATQNGLAPDVRERHDHRRRGHTAAGLAHSLRTVGSGSMPDLRPALPDVTIPVDLVVGERDAKFRSLAASMAEGFPRAELHVVRGAGHDVVLEAPAAVSALIARRMRRAPGLFDRFDRVTTGAAP